tara:strand:+ start:765 stop:1466 length:702 start_codon:yes stop_codon:yes gene_type:complete
MNNKNLRDILNILGIRNLKDLQKKDLDVWHQKRFIEIQRSSIEKESISKQLIELNNAKEIIEKYDFDTLRKEFFREEDKEILKTKLVNKKKKFIKDFLLKKKKKELILFFLILTFTPITYLYNDLKFSKYFPGEDLIDNINGFKTYPKKIKITCMKCLEPEYPKELIKKKKVGEVTIQVTILKNGNTKDPILIKSSGYSSFDNAAINAASNSLFFPIVEKSTLKIIYSFKINE